MDVSKLEPIFSKEPTLKTANASELRQEADGRWFATLKSPPVDGKANDELIRLVAGYFRCSKSAVSIRSGAARRVKLVKIGST